MRAVSPKRARQLRVYRPARDAYLTEHHRCQFPGGCIEPSTDLHHKAGRRGEMLLDQTRWAALCRAHHSWVTEHPAAAVEMGISELRNGVTT
jgi:hypothetical protein